MSQWSINNRVKTIYPHKELCDKNSSSFVEAAYYIYGHVSVRKTTTNKMRDWKNKRSIMVCVFTEYEKWGETNYPHK